MQLNKYKFILIVDINNSLKLYTFYIKGVSSEHF